MQTKLLRILNYGLSQVRKDKLKLMEDQIRLSQHIGGAQCFLVVGDLVSKKPQQSMPAN